MLKATLKSIRGHIGRTVATAMAVILGISFLAGTLIFTDSVRRAFDDLFATVFDTTDAQVRSTEVVDAGFGFQVRTRMPESLTEQVLAVDGVEAVDPFVQGTATIIDADGEPIGNPGQGPPTFGFSWTADDELSQFTVSEGRPPTAPGEVVLDDTTADLSGYVIGDQVRVLASAGSETFELVGVARFGDSGSVGGATTALFELGEAQRVLGVEGTLDAIGVRATDGIEEEEIVRRINEILPAETEAITGTEATKEAQDTIAEGLSFFNIFLFAFAVIAVFVSAFVIANTFAILVAQRTREFALFRALGAARGQILRSVFAEALIVGVFGSILGIGLGVVLSYGLRAMLNGFGLELPSGGLIISSRTIVLSLALGTLVTIAAALFPAIRASRITPIEALREASAENWQRNTTRVVVGLAVVALGAVAILFGLLAPEIAFAGLGAGAMFIGVFILGPSIARPVARVIGAPIARLPGVTGRLARDNSMRNPKRTARTASALTVGVALVAGVTVLVASLKASVEDSVAEAFTGDIVINSGSVNALGGFSPELTSQAAQLEQVEFASSIRLTGTEINDDGDFTVAVDPASAFEIIDIGVTEGSVDALDDSTVFLHESAAESLEVGLGDTVSLVLAGFEGEVTVGAIYEDNSLLQSRIISQELFEQSSAEQLDFSTYVTLADGVSVSDGRAALDALVVDYPNVTVQDRQEFTESQTGQLDLILNLINALLGLAIIIAAFGIANTLRLSTIERTREIGLLRAVGMVRPQVQSTIRWEAVITAVFGALLGVFLGLFFGYAIILALRDQGVSSFSVPVVSLIVVVVLAAIVGLLASVIPAIRASRLNILEAIATN